MKTNFFAYLKTVSPPAYIAIIVLDISMRVSPDIFWLKFGLGTGIGIIVIKIIVEYFEWRKTVKKWEK